MGANGSGKSRIVECLTGQTLPSKHMSITYIGPCILAPSEFLENHYFYTSLITAAVDSTIVVMVQNALHTTSVFPPLFATAFTRRILGVITNSQAPEARPDLAQRFLHSAGAREIVSVDFPQSKGLDMLRQLLYEPA